MTSSVQSQITNMQTWTNIQKGEELATNGASTELDQNAFLTLMMEQMKYQDPLEPVGNTEFLAQQAQFTQVNELQKLNDAINANNQVVQACSLIGQDVTITDPNDTSQTISGNVSEVTFSGSDAQIVLNGKEYPLGLIVSVATPQQSSQTVSQ